MTQTRIIMQLRKDSNQEGVEWHDCLGVVVKLQFHLSKPLFSLVSCRGTC